MMHHFGFCWLLHNSVPGKLLPNHSSPSHHHIQSPIGHCVLLPLGLRSGEHLLLAELWMETLQRDDILAGGLREANVCLEAYAVVLGPIYL